MDEELQAPENAVQLRSTWLDKTWYDDGARSLFVTTIVGSAYEKENVDRSVFEAFCQADSPGRFFNEHLRHRRKTEAVPLKRKATVEEIQGSLGLRRVRAASTSKEKIPVQAKRKRRRRQ